MPFSNTFSALSIIGGGLWVVCSSVFATAGWTAPPCLAAASVSAVALLLGGITDAHTHSKGNAQTTAARRDLEINLPSNRSVFHRVHDNGWLEEYSGRLGDLWGTNKTINMVNLKSGYLHNVNMWNNKLVVRTDVKQVPHTLGRSTTNRHRDVEPPILGRPETFLPRKTKSKRNKRITSSEMNEELSSYFFSGSNPSASFVLTSSMENYAGQQIANQAWELGTYCMTLLTCPASGPPPGTCPGTTDANIGIALEGPEHSSPVQPACKG